MSAPQPDLPEPAHSDIDSMLSRKFGKEVANYFSGSPLNRVSFLRGDSTFLSSAFLHPSTRFILFRSLQPLTSSPSALYYTKRNDVIPLVGENPFSKTEAQMIEEYNSSVTIPQMIFLGLDERRTEGAKTTVEQNVEKQEGESSEDEGELVWKEVYKGRPMFAVDVSPNGTIKDTADTLIKELEGRGLEFFPGRMPLGLPAPEAAIFAQARALLDWNARNPFCAQCGQPTLSTNAGGKRTCPPKDLSKLAGSQGATTGQTPVDPSERPPCATRNGVSNVCFPRTDPTVIMAVVSADGKRIMLGRQKRWPQYWYSTLAGFCEPAESIEEAVRREVWEEAGVTVGRVVIHSTQPWPFPANLMIGAIAQATPTGEKIDLGNDPELDDAKWFSFTEIREALRVGTSGLGDPAGPDYVEGGVRLPPATAIAHQLMRAVVGGFADEGGQKL